MVTQLRKAKGLLQGHGSFSVREGTRTQALDPQAKGFSTLSWGCDYDALLIPAW